MPGIAGIIYRQSSLSPISDVEQMVKSMRHETHYTTGLATWKALGIGVGWASLGGTQGAGHPLWNEAGSVCVFLHGELFPCDNSRFTSSQSNDPISRGQIQLLLQNYEKHGSEALEGLNGRYVGVIIDLREQIIVLFNDRFGLGRVYVYEDPQRLIFASEAKAILRLVPSTRAFNSRALGEFLVCGCPLQDRTLFEGISLMAPGSAWCVSPGLGVKKGYYFTASHWENAPTLAEDDYFHALQSLFPKILKRYFKDDRQIAMSLTGGLDSRLIMAWASCPSGSLPCYTFGGRYRDCADVKLARRIASVCGHPYQVIQVEADFLAQFPKLAERSVYITDGAMDVTGAVELYVNRVAREIAPVRMTGNYGSELLRRHIAFKPNRAKDNLFADGLASDIAEAKTTYESEAACDRLTFILTKQMPWHHYARLALEESQIEVRSPFLDNQLVALAFQAPSSLASTPDLSLRLIADGNPTLAKIPTDRALRAGGGIFANRVGNAYQRFMAKAEYAYDYGMPQCLAKVDRVLTPLKLERLFLGHQKFYHFRIWYQNELASFVRDVLLDPATLSRSIYNPRQVEAIVKGHTSGWWNFTSDIHRLLTVELIQRSLFES